jgi:hypothetical protein
VDKRKSNGSMNSFVQTLPGAVLRLDWLHSVRPGDKAWGPAISACLLTPSRHVLRSEMLNVSFE